MPADVSDADLARVQRQTRTWGGVEAKIIRGSDGRVRVVNPDTGTSLGVVISEEDADALATARAGFSPVISRGCLACAIACGALMVFCAAYAAFQAGRFFPIH